VWLTIDIGNSTTKVGLYFGNKIQKRFFSTSIKEVIERIEAWNHKTPYERIGLCSVVDDLTYELISSIKMFTNVPIFELSSDSLLPIRVSYDPVESLGVDRIAAASGAWSFGQKAKIIIDAGSAITVDLVSRDGTFLGGVIMPGPKLSSIALLNFTSNLPDVDVTLPHGTIGNSTITAIQHGLIYGMIDGVNGIVRRIHETYEEPSDLILTGGWSRLLTSKLPRHETNRHLVLDGLMVIMELNPI